MKIFIDKNVYGAHIRENIKTILWSAASCIKRLVLKS